MNETVLPREFYANSTLEVAKNLLGKTLAVKSEAGQMRGMIVETEAYLFDDPASHSFRGQTPRNSAMFGPPGHVYVYFTYGCHFMLNVVTNNHRVGEAVLIRALEPISGIEIMRANRGSDVILPDYKLCAGPGRLAKALGITIASHNGWDLCADGSIITILDAPKIAESDIFVSPRIGIRHAVENPWRFSVRRNKSVSK